MSTSESSPVRSAFFYGTLMAPQVLHRVCHGSMASDNPVYTASNLIAKSAILHNYRRHRVKHADYPGILAHPSSTVRGTYVTNLTDNDIWRLDVFEGSEYVREKVKCSILTTVGSSEADNVEGEEVECETYVWIEDPDQLEESEWDFEEFQREKMRFWVGSEGEGEYAEVDKAVAAANANDGTRGRGANGHITNALKEETRKSAV